jgi:hypothetical protein
MNYWVKIGLWLLGVWAVAGGAIYWARHSQPTAQSVAEYLESAHIASTSGAKRANVIDNVESMLNHVSYDDRQLLNRNGTTRDFFKSLTPDEQAAFLDATLPAGFKQMMDSFNKMDPAKRRRFVDRALADMKKREGEAPPQRSEQDERLGQRVIDQGLQSFYKDANADVKMDLAPLIEQMQKNIRNGP